MIDNLLDIPGQNVQHTHSYQGNPYVCTKSEGMTIGKNIRGQNMPTAPDRAFHKRTLRPGLWHRRVCSQKLHDMQGP